MTPHANSNLIYMRFVESDHCLVFKRVLTRHNPARIKKNIYIFILDS